MRRSASVMAVIVLFLNATAVTVPAHHAFSAEFDAEKPFTKNSLMPGTEIVVEGYQAKDGAMRANGRDLTLPDGRKLFMGSSGTGAPKDGADPAEKKQGKKQP